MTTAQRNGLLEIRKRLLSVKTTQKEVKQIMKRYAK